MDNFFEVPLFPIPDLVAFPDTSMPLHVFEPRYRAMIADAVENDRMIGITNTKKRISTPRENQSIKEALSQNQATYEPQDIFCVGAVKVLEKTKDGRIYVNINLKHRVVLIEETQTLPYRICKCKLLEDEVVESAKLVHHQQEILKQMANILQREAPTELAKFDQKSWSTLDPGKFSFEIFKMIRFDPDVMQSLLEMTDPEKRLILIKETLFGRTGSD
ncbi:MAG: LON peptidase substrate-binding domain-containing protein [Pseudomonadota bacterium]|nr:LON peptidase substrate-binding domain-containing protein [Pseudomonadota bacterium]